MSSPNPYRILIADDNPNIRRALRAILETEGFEVLEAGDGRQAIELLLNETVHLSILDLAMPFFDGLEVLRELRVVRGNSIPPVLILTAYDSVTAAMESARRGAVAFLCKPITPEALRAAVHKAIDQSAQVPRLDQQENFLG
jgi:DNA-binding response OmpR family regulator